MRNILKIYVCFICMQTITWAQAPMAFKYQAVARDAKGALIINKNMNVRVGIRDLNISGSIVFQESHAITTNSFGIININIGTGTVTLGSFSGIIWSNGNKFIELELDLGNGFVSIGTSQLLSVPYALYAANGPQGPQGVPGPQGIPGTMGPTSLYRVFQQINTDPTFIADTTDLALINAQAVVYLPLASSVAKGKVITVVRTFWNYPVSANISLNVQGSDVMIGIGLNSGTYTTYAMGTSSYTYRATLVSDGVSKWYCVSQ